ncbi:hypothetical protein FE257_006780 [Aspergillus nanangensis]|uniref:AMP-dependent synthetase/ligase domain-containing protein n=1 Tax=Aspergillus nanangensis TaxID=2582783 RepID=A0AAD4CQE4_ASPNN|nr:hypothetical protein FE257_006780 [Aspergillus nanangensis]
MDSITLNETSPLTQAAIWNNNVSEFIEFARTHSDFYKKLYSSLPSGPLTLSQLPILEPTTFWASNPTTGDGLPTTPHVDGVVLASGGSTAAPKITLVSKSELQAVSNYISSCLVAAGVWPGDRIANFFVAGDLYSSFLLTSMGITGCPIPLVLLPLGFGLTPQKMISYLQSQQATVAMGITTTLAKIAAALLKEGKVLPHIHLLLFSGEHLYEDQRGLIQRAFPNAAIRSLAYGSMDCGLVGRPAEEFDDPKVHKVNHPTVIIEIVDAEGNAITEPGKPGTIVSTNLCRRLVPIIRYPVGDIGEWVDHAKNLFRVLGRDQKEVRVGVVSIEAHQLRSMIEQTLSDADRASFHGAQIRLERKELRDQMIFRVACAPADPEKVNLELAEALNRLKPWFKDHVAAGFLHPLVVEWVDMDGLETAVTTGKTLLIVDKRL